MYRSSIKALSMSGNISNAKVILNICIHKVLTRFTCESLIGLQLLCALHFKVKIRGLQIHLDLLSCYTTGRCSASFKKLVRLLPSDHRQHVFCIPTDKILCDQGCLIAIAF